ncbi:MAG: hypothetical protein CMK09_13005 [Ponticaulis sp.]|nr:hypothetical protein [Ponticaulis sp.]|tara:strand:- start:19920 stop:20921 length:1002 start_codon:yes stop_codon:yes gene_type:complete
MRREIPLEVMVLFYFLSYLPNIIVVKLATMIPHQALGRPLTGLETLPATLVMNLILTYLFIWLSGWHRDANHYTVAGFRFPFPTPYTFLSGIGTALVLFTVPLSYTFEGVSIPYIQLLMRGDILIIAPLVDLAFRRKVHWWSWVALVMVLASLALVLNAKGELGLPPLAIATVVLYTIGYFMRLTVMTRISKSGNPASVRRYFVEEKIVALPIAIIVLALLSMSGLGSQASSLTDGFFLVWSDPVIVYLIAGAVTLTVVSVFAAIILLDKRENTYCVPLERSASLLAGVSAAWILAFGWGLAAPTTSEMIGASVLIMAIVLLSLAPRFSRKVD